MKIWAVHQCVDRLPETLPAARELLQFGLELTNQEILHGNKHYYIGTLMSNENVPPAVAEMFSLLVSVVLIKTLGVSF
ncbi:hypothetical protein JYU34_003698 [Plutella xylostella]|uniref:Uncharacterized protein n=1 Tax=Plutella xylostella TaxID=51655 RepID=A0ABQ7R0P3_PLUXY|nr:hypothetical protein JYU34_003698 [Plutella xylostella]